MSDLATFLTAALEVADATDGVIRTHVASGFSSRHKADRSFVTDVDLAVEQHVRDEIGRRFPEHGILGEELEDTTSRGDYTWVVDPVDGTMSLTHGIPLYGTLIALLDRGEPVVGVISLPGISARAWAARGAGAWVDGERITLRSVDDDEAIMDEVIAVGERRQFVAVGLEEPFDRLMRSHPGVRVYCDCFGHLLAIRGAAGAMVDYGLRIWDWAPSRVIVEEAGGVFEIVGEREIDGEKRYDVLLGKPPVVEWVKRAMLAEP